MPHEILGPVAPPPPTLKDPEYLPRAVFQQVNLPTVLLHLFIKFESNWPITRGDMAF